jgi:hypothetical protein
MLAMATAPLPVAILNTPDFHRGLPSELKASRVLPVPWTMISTWPSPLMSPIAGLAVLSVRHAGSVTVHTFAPVSPRIARITPSLVATPGR